MSVSECALERFLTAQNEGEPSRLEQALAELRGGQKSGHWIWFVLPQLTVIGRSSMARRYAIANLREARMYRADSQHRQRLKDVTNAISEQVKLPGQSLPELMGGQLDASKTISCLTLFEAAGLENAGALLEELGKRCPRTLYAFNIGGGKLYVPATKDAEGSVLWSETGAH